MLVMFIIILIKRVQLLLINVPKTFVCSHSWIQLCSERVWACAILLWVNTLNIHLGTVQKLLEIRKGDGLFANFGVVWLLWESMRHLFNFYSYFIVQPSQELNKWWLYCSYSIAHRRCAHMQRTTIMSVSELDFSHHSQQADTLARYWY